MQAFISVSEKIAWRPQRATLDFTADLSLDVFLSTGIYYSILIYLEKNIIVEMTAGHKVAEVEIALKQKRIQHLVNDKPILLHNSDPFCIFSTLCMTSGLMKVRD